MPVRKIIHIDEEKCNGCGECIVNCPEGALQIVDGKARLVKESYCDGLGACIGKCPLDAITLEEREAESFDQEAVEKQMLKVSCPSGGCPGLSVKTHKCKEVCACDSDDSHPSQLSHWPVQIALVPPTAPFLQNADLVLAADCVPFAFADFHARFLKGGKPVIVGCPKFDNAEAYIDKLQTIMETANLKSLTILRMEVPCCGGMTRIAEMARKHSGAQIPITEVTISIDGKILSEKQL